MTTQADPPGEAAGAASTDDSRAAIWNEFAAADAGEDHPDREEPAAKDGDDPDDPGDGEAAETADSTGTDKADTPEARLKALEEQNQRLEHALKSEQGRTRAKTREVEALQGRLKLNRDAVARANVQAQTDKASQAKLANVAKEYPEVGAPLVAEIGRLKAAKQAEVSLRVAEIKADERALSERIAAEEAVFLEEHPEGLQTIVENKAVFKAWIEDQPKRVRDAYEVNRKKIVDGAAAASVVTRFKLALAQAAASKAPAEDPEQKRLASKRQAQLDGARTTKAGSSPPPLSGQSGGGSREDDWNHWKRQDEKKAAARR